MHNEDNPDIDINYNEALSSFSFPYINNVTVAVYDQGLEFDHPDLSVLPSSKSYDMGYRTSPSRLFGAHGMACAGIVAASHNDKGSAGIAPGAKVMSVSGPFDVGWTSSDEYEDAFKWIADNGADVISCSWNASGSNDEIEGITYALEHGRGGKGSVVVFASGNDNRNTVSSTAGCVPGIIVVGAIDKTGKRFSNYSWGSNYGTSLDIMAPGTSIPTTDLQGSAGYTSGDYYNSFNGTSSACPHVAGVAALMLSVNPDLTGKQVADIIESTAQKIGGYSYTSTSSRPNGTWNNEMGYGLVDAGAASEWSPVLNVLLRPNSIPLATDEEEVSEDTDIELDNDKTVVAR